MVVLYRIVLYLLLPLVMLRLILRALRDRRYWQRIPQRLGFYPRGNGMINWINVAPINIAPGGVWVHAVSVGEVNAATPLVERLLENYPDKPILITTMTPTGADRVAKTFGGRVAHCYLPWDYPGAVRRFLNSVRPCLAVVMETEIWPNLIARCHHLDVPMMYVNMRVSKRAHRGYRRFRKLIRPTLQKISCFAVQSRTDARRLIRLGAPPDSVSVVGNLKFDVVLPASIREAAQSVRRDWSNARPVWLAGSTHEGEEAQILDAFARLRTDFKSLLLVIVPRHPQRFTSVFRLCVRRGYRTILRSLSSAKLSPDTDIYIADTMGELPLLIAASDVAFIGGSLVPVGGHNVLEASAAGIPVVFGQHMFNFAEIADLLQQHAAGIAVMNSNELAEVVRRLLADPLLRDQYANQGRALVEKNRGALRKVCALVDGVLMGR